MANKIGAKALSDIFQSHTNDIYFKPEDQFNFEHPIAQAKEAEPSISKLQSRDTILPHQMSFPLNQGQIEWSQGKDDSKFESNQIQPFKFRLKQIKKSIKRNELCWRTQEEIEQSQNDSLLNMSQDQSMLQETNLQLNGRLTAMYSNKNSLFLGDENGQITLYDLGDRQVRQEWQLENSQVNKLMLISEFLHAFLSNGNVYKFTKQGFQLTQDFKAADNFIQAFTGKSSLIIVYKNKIQFENQQEHCPKTSNYSTAHLNMETYRLAVGKENGKMQFFNIQTKQHLTTKQPEETAPVNCIIPYRSYFVSSQHLKIQVWSSYLTDFMYEMRTEEPVLQLKTTKMPGGSRYLVGVSNQYVIYASLNDKCILGQIHYGYMSITNFCLFNDDILLFQQDGSTVLGENYIYSSRTHISGNIKQIQQLKLCFERLFQGKKLPKPDHSLANLTVFPHLINIVHLYAYKNDIDNLKKIMNSELIMIATKDRDTPISLSFILGNKEMAQLFVNGICQSLERNQNAAANIESSLIQLNRHGFSVLQTVYNLGFKISNSDKLKRYCKQSDSLPKIITNVTTTINQQKFQEQGVHYETHGRSIEFLTSYFRVPITPGASQSLSLLESFMNCSCQDIFRTRFVRSLIHYKWWQVRWLLYIQGFLYFLYLFGLLILLNYRDELWIQIVMVILNSLLLIYELIQWGFSGSLYYWQDYLNYIDLVRASICYGYLGEIISDFGESTSDALLFSLTFISFIRGLFYFKLFQKTRYLVNMTIQVLIDLRAFLTVLLYSAIAFSIVQYTQESLFKLEKDIDYFKSSYFMILGDFDEVPLYVIPVIIIVSLTVFNTVMLLNLIISVIDDTYDRVQCDINIIDIQELITMVLEAEYMLSWKKPVDKWEFLQLCREYGKETLQDEPWEGKLRTLMNNVDKMTPDIFATYMEVNSYIQKVNETKQREETEVLTKKVKDKFEEQDKLFQESNQFERLASLEKQLSVIVQDLNSIKHLF